MNKKSLIVLVLLLAAFSVWAHTPMLSIEDNYDGSISVEGAFSNGASMSGMPVLIVDAAKYKGSEKTYDGQKVLFETVFDDLGQVDLLKPDVEKYFVIFDGGPGHTVSMAGPALADDERDSWNDLLQSMSDELGKWKDYLTGKK
ncbi:MAG: hypothetical protein CSA76_01475 [Spirochaetales bacterium]|nr:MAG: hypothetical protein CSA76_01475 [Spirochaetales bacterium]